MFPMNLIGPQHPQLVITISNLSPTHLVSNIRRQHQCNLWPHNTWYFIQAETHCNIDNFSLKNCSSIPEASVQFEHVIGEGNRDTLSWKPKDDYSLIRINIIKKMKGLKIPFKGYFGIVYLAYYNGHRTAAKKIKSDFNLNRQFIKEAKVELNISIMHMICSILYVTYSM